MVSYTPLPLYHQEKSPYYPLHRKLCVGPRVVLDEVVKSKIPSPRRESNPRTPFVQPVASRYIFNNLSMGTNVSKSTNCNKRLAEEFILISIATYYPLISKNGGPMYVWQLVPQVQRLKLIS
jgi:hypothetical protein